MVLILDRPGPRAHGAAIDDNARAFRRERASDCPARCRSSSPSQARACFRTLGSCARTQEAEIHTVPPIPTRARKLPYKHARYRERNRIERFVDKMKHFRCIATRYDKLAKTFFATLCIHLNHEFVNRNPNSFFTQF